MYDLKLPNGIDQNMKGHNPVDNFGLLLIMT